jgi:hypothetical protein
MRFKLLSVLGSAVLAAAAVGMMATPAHASSGGGCTTSPQGTKGVVLRMGACISVPGGSGSTVKPDTYTNFHTYNASGGWTSCTITIVLDRDGGEFVDGTRDCKAAANAGGTGEAYFAGPMTSNVGNHVYQCHYYIEGYRNGVHQVIPSRLSPQLFMP